MNLSEFIRIISEAPERFSWLFGAGMSQSAGLPTAVDVMWDLKRQFYASEENLRIAPNEVQNPAIREKIDGYMQSRGFPPPGDPNRPRIDHVGFGLVLGKDGKRIRTRSGGDVR